MQVSERPHEVTIGRHLDREGPSCLKMSNRGQRMHPQDAVGRILYQVEDVSR